MPSSVFDAVLAKPATGEPGQLEPVRLLARRTLDLGNLLLAAGRFADARRALETGVLLDGTSSDLLFSLGNACYLAGDLEAAAEAFRNLIAIWPAHAEGHYNLGVIRMREGRLQEAADRFERALAIRPAYADARNNLAVVTACRQPDQKVAERALRQAAPHSAEARYNLAMMRQKAGDVAEARRLYRAILNELPDHADAANNLGNLEMDAGRPGDALALFDRALRAAPGHAQANWNRCLALLSLGRYSEGWPAYEWRFRQPESSPRLGTTPRWQPSQPASRLLVHAEQGLGDTLQFARFAPQAAALCDALHVEVQPSLLRLFERCLPAASIVALAGPPPDADAQLPMMSLPAALASEAVPDQVPYFTADPERVQSWKERLGARDRFRVGIVWSGNPRHRNDKRRSLPPRLLTPLIAVPRTAFYSLNPAQSVPIAGVESLLDRGADFDDTAALVTLLDLVISVDTSVAHLAGALGRPVWTLLPFAADWRWQQSRPDTPWYPTMRLFRQTSEGDWTGILGKVRDALERAVSAAFTWA